VGFVKTPDEICRVQAALSAPEFVSGQRLSIQFRTDPGTLADLLPPPLTPADEPIATATVGRWQSNCVGEFAGGMVYLTASFDGGDGAYVLAMYMDGEPSIAFGREVLGEPKKLARASLFRNGSHVTGWVERHGVRLVDLVAELETDAGPAETDRCTFNVKARLAAGGVGLQEDAILTRTRYHTVARTQLQGSGSVMLGSTAHDPLADLPVLELISAVYAEEDASASCSAVATIDADTFLPYHLGRHDDWLALDTRPATAHGRAAASRAGA
jgi:acetoacetate decarboxylase